MSPIKYITPKEVVGDAIAKVTSFRNIADTLTSLSTSMDLIDVNDIQQRRKGKKGNRNKRRGTEFEYRVSAYYTRKGFTVLRARGSFGPADLIALKTGERDIYIQCKNIKSNYFDRHEMSDFVGFCSKFSKRCVWAYNYYSSKNKRGRMKFINLMTTPIDSITKEYYANGSSIHS